MTLAPAETSEHQHLSDNFASSHSSRYGSLCDDPKGLCGDCLSVSGIPRALVEGVDADVLDEKLRGLRLRDPNSAYAAVPGQRISDYENALASKASKRAYGPGPFASDLSVVGGRGISLMDFPNEVLTHVFSHLPPDSHSSLSLVCKRFWALVTTHHAWRIAFMRHFPAHTEVQPRAQSDSKESSPDILRSETRFFPRLTLLATWRSEYLLRTRYLRSLARGKPGIPLGAARSGKKPGAVLTYNSRLPWRITNVHAVFSNGKKPARVIQGAGDLGVATISDPTTGKIEKWGVEDLFSAPQLEEVATGLVPYGLGQGPAAAPNVIDVSQQYGMIAGEGFPGGRAYFRGVNEPRGRYLNAEIAVAGADPGIPQIPELMDAICSVWVAKSPAVTSTTQFMCGMMTGSSLGVITSYSLGCGATRPRFASSDVTARWVLSPGVPIISLKIDDGYSQARKSRGRVWAVALNALGEVFHLVNTPDGKPVRAAGGDAMNNAWKAGRTARWLLLEATRRVPREDLDDDDAVLAGCSPRSFTDGVDAGQDQLVAEAEEANKLFRLKPDRIRRVFDGWDMQRKLEVDFASDDGRGAGESIFVVDCGLAEGRSACIRRFVRSTSQHESLSQAPRPTQSILEPAGAPQAVEPQSPYSPPPTPESRAASSLHGWTCQDLDLQGHGHCIITALALDNSTTSLLTLDEDALLPTNDMVGGEPRAGQAMREIPGRRARFIVAGTNTGAVLAWNARDEERRGGLQPVRIIQTESPEVSCVAASALYLVHGGSDGLVQAWDPLTSIAEPVRTINAKFNGRTPRHMTVMNPSLREADYAAVGAIFLDPDPTVIQGIVSFGAYLRSWSYSSSSRMAGKKRAHYAGTEGRHVSRREGGVEGHIAAEEREVRLEDEQRARERERLVKRFGDLTEEEAMAYAQMLSEEEFRRESSSTDTVTPDASVAERAEDEYEEQMQRAIRLSLMEGGVSERGRADSASAGGEEEDLAIALSLSMQDHGFSDGDFPSLPNGTGKGKNVQW